MTVMTRKGLGGNTKVPIPNSSVNTSYLRGPDLSQNLFNGVK